MRYVIFTDLDGTLLDASYHFQEAVQALLRLKHRKVPTVLCTSKTSAETLLWRTKLGLDAPFIVENGGALLLPRDYFHFPYPFDIRGEEFDTIILGETYQQLRLTLRQLQGEGFPVRGFGDMSAAEIASLTGLSPEQAYLAKQREYDEPFLIENKMEGAVERMAASVGQRGLRISRGGQFYHLTGESDKGRAAEILARLYRQTSKRVVLVGIGDSENDLPMLEQVDLPFLVARPDGSYASPGHTHAPGIGPHGWSWVISRIMSHPS